MYFMRSKDRADRSICICLRMKNIFDFIFVLRIPIDGTLYVTIYILYFDLKVKLKARNMKYTPTLFNC